MLDSARLCYIVLDIARKSARDRVLEIERERWRESDGTQGAPHRVGATRERFPSASCSLRCVGGEEVRVRHEAETVLRGFFVFLERDERNGMCGEQVGQ